MPLSYKQKLRPEVWNLSLHSSGIAVRFASNSTTIDLKWKTGNSTHFPHGAETLIKGVDLYCLQNGKWFFAGAGKPYDPEYNQATLIKGMDASMKEFLLFLPMYEIVDSVFIGIEAAAKIKNPLEGSRRKLKPILLVGHLFFTSSRFNQGVRKSIDSINVAFQNAFSELKKMGWKNFIIYLREI